ncbi:hypothetical protein PPACK8108_LOCUS10284 [Phakopsora pachyrhizi]|uniref:Uncharacterized protein n=1 Tax=Phakopsora pachyrhizi TaxID=170000 RepID=A0AAV0B322_PHAPC|nr:hypothetical protein PPACK8108_LOCUS10284 [Phakopsora pachyrhizi]
MPFSAYFRLFKNYESDIGPPPAPHSLIDQDFSPITTHSQDWMDVNNGFFEVRQYTKPCAFCTRNNLVRYRRGNTAETEDKKYRPTVEVPNPPQGESTIPTAGKYPAHQSTSSLPVPKSHPPKSTLPRVVAQRPLTTSVTPGVDDLEPWVPEGSELQFEGFTHDRRLAMALLVDIHYQLGQGIGELIRGNPTKGFMELAAVSDQMELEMTEMIKQMGSWLEHLELNGMVPYEAWEGSKGKGRDEGDPEE